MPTFSRAPVEPSASLEQEVATATLEAASVTGQRGSESRREESESRLAGIVASAMDAIVTVDETQRIVLFNPATERMFGRAGDEVRLQPLDMLIPARVRAAHRQPGAPLARSESENRG